MERRLVMRTFYLDKVRITGQFKEVIMYKKYTFFEKDCIREFESFEDALDYYEEHDHDYFECLLDEFHLKDDYDPLDYLNNNSKSNRCNEYLYYLKSRNRMSGTWTHLKKRP